MSSLTGANQPGDEVRRESGIWREARRVHSYDVDFSQAATAEAICRWFLEGAWNHAEQLGIGYTELTGQNRLWVLARLFVRFEGPAKWGEKLQLSTWPRGISSVFALRDFELHNSEGAILVAGTSSWLVLDATSHRPQRLDKLLLKVPAQVSRQAVGRDAQKLADAEINQSAFTTRVRYSDIDVNCHVNSARYVGWLADSFPEEFHRKHRLQSIELNYVGETKWQEDVSVLWHQRAPQHYDHLIVNSKGASMCRAELVWNERSKPGRV